DGPLTWYDWSLAEANHDLVTFTRDLIALRQRHEVLRRTTFFTGEEDLHWLKPDGTPMTQADWLAHSTRSLAFFLNGREIDSRDDRGRPIVDDSFLALLNADEKAVTYRIPDEA